MKAIIAAVGVWQECDSIRRSSLRPPGHFALTGPNANVSFGSTRDSSRDITLKRIGNPHRSVDLRRREFLIRFCQGAGAALVPASLWGMAFPGVRSLTPSREPDCMLRSKNRKPASTCLRYFPSTPYRSGLCVSPAPKKGSKAMAVAPIRASANTP